MRAPADQRVLLRWLFLALGLLIVLAPGLVLHSLFLSDWAELLYPNDPRHRARLLGWLYVLLLPGGLLCLATARGLNRSKPWARWCGILTCLLLLAGFPWLTIAGAVGLYVWIARPPLLGKTAQPGQSAPAQPSKDYWTSKRRSIALPAISTVVGFAALLMAGWLVRYARRAGLVAPETGWEWWVYLSVSLLAQTAVHEFGHATMAWALHSHVKVISIGPFTLSRDRYGFQFHFNWQRLLDTSGYMGAVPASETNLRLRQIAIVAAGPIASMLAGLVFLALFFGMLDAHWQGYLRIVAYNAAIGLYYGVANLVPLGYSDGSMLFHLILGTRPGHQLLGNVMMARIQEDADACHNQADFEKETDLRQKALQKAVDAGAGNEMAIATCHQYLGHARVAAEDWRGAEREFRRCLAFEAECAGQPLLAANAWSGLQKACVERHRAAEAKLAYTTAVALIESRQKNRDRVGLAVTHVMLAQVHLRAGSLERAQEEAGAGLKILPSGQERLLLRAMLYAVRAQSELGQTFVDSGLASATRAADILRSGQIPPGRRNLAWDDLGELGEGLWEAGQPAAAVELMHESIDRLETGEAAATAARYRIKLAGMLRHLGRLEEASRLLPAETGLADLSRRLLLAERARHHLAAARPTEALADSQELLLLWHAEPSDAAPEIAAAKCLLAQACLDAGGWEQAEALARKAAEALAPGPSPEAAACLVTRALARWRGAREWTPSFIAQARNLIETDPLLTPSAKARFLEAEARRLERHGRPDDAEALRESTPAQWSILGIESQAVSGTLAAVPG